MSNSSFFIEGENKRSSSLPLPLPVDFQNQQDRDRENKNDENNSANSAQESDGSGSSIEIDYLNNVIIPNFKYVLKDGHIVPNYYVEYPKLLPSPPYRRRAPNININILPNNNLYLSRTQVATQLPFNQLFRRQINPLNRQWEDIELGVGVDNVNNDNDNNGNGNNSYDDQDYQYYYL
jgi:hypothetical protein